MGLYPTFGGGNGLVEDPEKTAELLRLFDQTLGQGKSTVDSFKQPETLDILTGNPFSERGSFQDPAFQGSAVPQGLEGPIQNTEKRPGFLGRIRQQPGGRQALLAFGANLLSSQNFFDGLGKGALAYQQTLDSEAEKLRPQLTRDGNFSYQRDPQTGEMLFKRTPVADFEEDLVRQKLQASLAGIKIRDEGATQRKETELNYQDRWNTLDNDTKMNVARLNAKTDLEIAELNAAADLERAKVAGSGQQTPVGVQKQIGDYTTVRNGLSNAVSRIQPVLSAINSGKLTFNLASNLRHKAAIATGVGGNEQTVLYSQFQTTLESLRNALLIANTGVQTDGDADRAMNELLSGSGNTETIAANLNTVYASLLRRQQQAQDRIDDLSQQYGANVSNSSPRTNTRRGNGGGQNSLRAKYGLE